MSSKLGIVFPGQGSQSVGMLADIAADYPLVQETFAQASDVLGYDLWQLASQGPAQELDQTMHTQPALLAASYAIWRILTSTGNILPHVLAGHSLGEYTALVCADALGFTDAIKLVAARGQYMQEAVATGVGAMAAIVGLSDADVLAICEQVQAGKEQVLSPANFNSLGQVVIAGHKVLVEQAIVLAKEKGAKLAIFIPVSVPSHCELMQPAAKRLANLLETITFRAPTLPVINNVEVGITNSPDEIKANLIKQLYKPVRWVETIQCMIKEGVDTIIECGPGKVLTGLNKRIDKNLKLLTTANKSELENVLNHENERSV